MIYRDTSKYVLRRQSDPIEDLWRGPKISEATLKRMRFLVPPLLDSKGKAVAEVTRPYGDVIHIPVKMKI